MTFSEWKTNYPNLTAFYTPNEETVRMLLASKELILTKLFVSQLRDAHQTAFDPISGTYRFEYYSSYSNKIVFCENRGGSSNFADGDRFLRREYAPTVEFEIVRSGRVFSLVSFPKEKINTMLNGEFECKVVMKPGDELRARVAWPLITRDGDRDKTATALTQNQRTQLNKHVGRLNMIAQGVS